MSLFVRAEKFMTFRFRGSFTRSWISHSVGELLISSTKTYLVSFFPLRVAPFREPKASATRGYAWRWRNVTPQWNSRGYELCRGDLSIGLRTTVWKLRGLSQDLAYRAMEKCCEEFKSSWYRKSVKSGVVRVLGTQMVVALKFYICQK